MKLQPDRLDQIATRFVEENVTNRHVQQEHSLYTDIYGVDAENPEEDLQTLFDIAIQNRAWPKTDEDYRRLSKKFDAEEFLSHETHQEAVTNLRQIDDIGPKIVDEFLRKAVHVFDVKEEWQPELNVPLDTHVVQALIKTGAIDLEDEDWEADRDRDYQRVVNTDPEASPDKLIAYSDVQDGFAEAAGKHDLPRIAFDELWVEHSRFISNPLLQSKSTVSDLILDEFRY